MEAKSEIIFCFHNVRVLNCVNDSFIESEDPVRNADDTLDYEHFLLETNPVRTPSFMHRNILGDKLPDWFDALPLMDLGFYFLLLEHGKGKYLNEVMAVYRVHKGGAWSGNTLYHHNYQLAIFNQIIQPYLPPVFRKKIDFFICYHYSILFKIDLLSGNYKNAMESFKVLRKYRFKGFSQRKAGIVIVILKAILMPFLKYIKRGYHTNYFLPL
jgi:hypothetical protein